MEGYEPLDFVQNSISYAFKSHDPPQNISSDEKSPGQIKTEVLKSPRIKRVAREVAESSSSDVEAVEQEVQALLDEIGHKMTTPAVRSLALALRSIFVQVLTGIYVNTDGIDLLAHLVTEWPVVLLPSHRSYLDFILVSYIMFEHNITLPCIAAGQDFMSMKGISPLLRRSGAFFLRRTFGSDKLYKAVFSEYVKKILCSGDNPLEFFVEGTRSRTGKSLHPRLGLLSMVMEPYLEGQLPDIMMVPISISYEKTFEEFLFARELLGVPKPKESTTALFKAYSVLSGDYGSIYIHIGKPISLHEVCLHQGINRVPHSILPREVSVLFPEERDVVEELGHIIVERTHFGMRVFPTALVATALLQYPNGLQLGELASRVEWIKAQVLLRGGHIGWDEKDNVKVVSSGLKKLPGVVKVSKDNLVQIDCPRLDMHSGPSVTNIQELMSSKVEVSRFDVVVDISLVHLQLAYYRNQMIHLFIEDAMVALSWDARINNDGALQRFLTLHCALACEFVLPRKNPNELFADGVQRFISRGLLYHSSNDKSLSVRASHSCQFSFLQNLLRPFVECVWLVCQYLLSLGGGVKALTAAVKGAQQLATSCLKTEVLHSFEILSLGMIKNSLGSLHQAGLILQASNEFGTGRDRLVKVIEKVKLAHLADSLGGIVRPYTEKSKL